ncbi:MAG: HYR domain-containing protein [Verrucomicrobiales bacterium]|nr:HYR domain-containing protein [Verrucomicrobiales bacterium]
MINWKSRPPFGHLALATVIATAFLLAATRSTADECSGTPPPSLTAGADKSVECGTPWSFDPVVAIDASNNPLSTEIVSTTTNILTPGLIAVDRTWRAIDACGNEREATQRVTVHEAGPPVIVCPTDISVDCPRHVSFAVTATADCPSSTVTLTTIPPSGSFFVAGVHTVVCTAVTESGLRSECQFKVTVAGNCDLPFFGGTAAVVEGNAQAALRADGSMRLHQIGSSGDDGIRLIFGGADVIRVNFDRSIQAGELPAGAVFVAKALDESARELASMRLQRHGTFAVFELLPNFRALGSSTYRLRVYKGSQLLYESAGRSVPAPNQFPLRDQVFLDAIPLAIRVENRSEDGVTFITSFGGPSGISLYNSGNPLGFSADRLELVAEPVEGIRSRSPLSELDLRMSGVAERVIASLALTHFRQEIRGSQGILCSASTGHLRLLSQPTIPASLELPTWPIPPPAWKPLTPVGYFDDYEVDNPSGFSGYWKDQNPLGYAADWDVKFDLTDKASTWLQQPGFRPGKSHAELKFGEGSLYAPGAELRFIAGGVGNTLPGSSSVTMGFLLFRENGGKIELSAGFPKTFPDPPPARHRCEIFLADGTMRAIEGTRPSVNLDLLHVPPGTLKAEIASDMRLALAVNFDGLPVRAILEDGEAVQVVSLHWTDSQVSQPPRWTPGSIRALVLAGKKVEDFLVRDLISHADNPTPSLFFAGHRVRPIGNIDFRLDPVGTLALSGLSQSGRDGVSIEFNSETDRNPSPPPGAITLGTVNLGYVPVSPVQFPRVGASLQVQWVGHDSGDGSAEGCCPVYAALGGRNLNDGSPYFFATRFPALHSTRHTLRLFRGDQLVFEQNGRVNEAEGARGNLLPSILPDTVTAVAVGGQFTWVLGWNRILWITSNDSSGSKDFLADRVEILAENGESVPITSGSLEVRASHIDTLRLLNLGDRTDPLVPTLNFGIADGHLRLDWSRTAMGIPKLQLSHSVNGPWTTGMANPVADERWAFDLETSADEGYARLVTPDLSEGCVNFLTQSPRERPNPWNVSGWTFERFDNEDTRTRVNRILESSGRGALEVDSRMDMELPTPGREVDIGFVHSGASIKWEAFDDLGKADEILVPPHATRGRQELVTLRAREHRPLRRLKATVIGDAVALRELCLRAHKSRDDASNFACLPLWTAEGGEVPNPWIQGDLTFAASNASGPLPNGRISRYGSSQSAYDTVGYEVTYQLELTLTHPRPFVELEFLSGSGQIEFQPYDDLDTPLPPYRLNRVTATSGETVNFKSGLRGIRRIVITTPKGLTRILKICLGELPAPVCRDAASLAARPLRNPQPVGDTVWTFRNASGDLATSAILTDPSGSEAGLELTADTAIEFATDQHAVELRLLVAEGAATLSAEATTLGGRNAAKLPEAIYASGVHSLTLTDYCTIGCGENIRRVRLKLSNGKASVSRVCTPTKREN